MNDIQTFIKAGGPEAAKDIVELLADSFRGSVQMSNLLLEWLVVLGGERSGV